MSDAKLNGKESGAKDGAAPDAVGDARDVKLGYEVEQEAPKPGYDVKLGYGAGAGPRQGSGVETEKKS